MHGPAVEEDDGQIAAINIIPLVDVVLVLMIIFMVTMVFVRDSSIPLELPKGSRSTTEKAPPAEITVTVDKNEQLYVNGAPCELKDLASTIETFRSANSNSMVVVRADRDIAYGKIIPVLDQTARSKVTITLAYTPPSAEEAVGP